MGMKDLKHEPQSQLAGNLVSGPKVAYSAGDDYAGLVSMAKDNADTMASVGSNLVSHQGGHHSTDKKPG